MSNLKVISRVQGLYSCQECDYKANNKKALYLHIKYSHGEKGKLAEDLTKSIPRCGTCGKLLFGNKICCLK